jgi:CRISPR-associated protein Csa2
MSAKVAPLYLAATFRVLVNVEAFNAIEPLGNVIRHRKASVAVSRDRSIEIVTVPTASGEALRHAYQYALAQLATLRGLPVCSWCRLGEFIKHGVPHDNVIARYSEEERKILNELKAEKSKSESKILPEDAEYTIIKNCVVEDVGGFLVPAGTPVKRTSRIQVSYLVPSMVEVKRGVFAVDIQFHVRHAPQAQAKVPQNYQPSPQSIYYVESASAVYTFSTVLDIGGIGIVVKSDGSVQGVEPSERLVRALLAVEALAEVVKSGSIGGKQSSYMPHWIPLSGVIVVSRPVKFVPTPPHVENYVSDTISNVKSQVDALKSIGIKDQDIKVYIAVFRSELEVESIRKDIDDVKEEKNTIVVQKFDRVAEAFKWVIDVVKNEMSTALGLGKS